MPNTYTPTAQDLAAARLYHELNSPDEPFNTAARSKSSYDMMRRWLKSQHYVYVPNGYQMQPTLPGMPSNRYVDPKD